MIEISEIFKSIQGESTRAGEVCAFVRLSGCNLDCSYCDTRYAREPGVIRSVDEVVKLVQSLNCKLVEITGGEPLMQHETPALCTRLIAEGYTVMVETNGSCDISVLPEGTVRIVDIKCPGSGMADSFLMKNIRVLKACDECKFVLTGRKDFDWALAFVSEYNINSICTVLFSPVHGMLESGSLAEWILECNAPVRLGLQLHKIIWGVDARGV
jgi:7-carboxy-7-deazaguanine synthase